MTTKRELLKLIRLNCQECMGGPRASKKRWPIKNIVDVDGCTAPACAFFPYRAGADPEPRKLSDAQMRVAMKAVQTMRLRKNRASTP